ncbi:MAG: type III secretion HpaP family protein [Opitutales bacterium]
MEVDKIAVNDNFSSENQKNTPTNSANDQDVRIFKKHVSDEHKDDVSTGLSDSSEDSVQDLGSLFRRLKLSDEKEQSQNQSNDTDSQENPQQSFYLKTPKKESDVPDKKLPQISTKLNENTTKAQKDSLNQPLIKTSTKTKLPSNNFNKDFIPLDVSKNKHEKIETSYLIKNLEKSLKDDLNKDFLINDNFPTKIFSEDSKGNMPQLTETLPVGGVGTTATESSGANVSTTVDSKASETTGLQASNTSIAQQIKDQIVDRILVSTASLNANQSVKVVFSPTVLAETEVNIQKLGQALQVQFVSSDVKSIAFIQSNQLDLQGYLQSNLKQFEEVHVSLKEMDNDLDQPKDGRSRNRNEYQSLEDDEDEQ